MNSIDASHMTWLKVLLIGLGVFASVVAVAGGGYWWWQRNGDALIAEARSAEADGTRFAAANNQQACVAEAVARAKKPGMSAPFMAQSFLTPCLRAARPVAGFCHGVPAPDEFLKSVSWARQRTTEYGLSPTEAPPVVQTIQRFCTSAAASGPDCTAFKSTDEAWQATRDTILDFNTRNGHAHMTLPAGTELRRNAGIMDGVDPVDVLDRRCRL